MFWILACVKNINSFNSVAENQGVFVKPANFLVFHLFLKQKMKIHKKCKDISIKAVFNETC